MKKTIYILPAISKMGRINGIAVLLLMLLAASCATFSSKHKTNTSDNHRRLQVSDGTGAYVTKTYRNLFAENGYSEQAINNKIKGAFQQLFYGDSATQSIYFSAGSNSHGPKAYILDVYNNDIRSEGMSYGMMISVQMGKKEVFDALWNYAVTHMYHADAAHPAEGYFSWSLKRSGTPNAETPAPDGEEYFVMALYFAAHQWGNGNGIYNYAAWADKILTAMRRHPVKTGPTTRGVQTVGPMVNESKKMILFVPTGPGQHFSDPSYHLPHFYDLWARWGPEAERAFWAAAADTSRQYFHKVTHPQTGLSPDYAHFDGKPVVTVFNKNSKHFAYDAWRTAMNWSVDWLWWQKDPQQMELSNKIQTFFYAQGMATYGSVYTLDGQVVEKNHAAGLIATNAVASLAATHPIAKDFIKALWNEPLPQNKGERYYGGLLYLMSLLHCSGQFQIHAPK